MKLFPCVHVQTFYWRKMYLTYKQLSKGDRDELLICSCGFRSFGALAQLGFEASPHKHVDGIIYLCPQIFFIVWLGTVWDVFWIFFSLVRRWTQVFFIKNTLFINQNEESVGIAKSFPNCQILYQNFRPKIFDEWK